MKPMAFFSDIYHKPFWERGYLTRRKQVCIHMKIYISLFRLHSKLFRLNWLYCCFLKVLRFCACCFLLEPKTVLKLPDLNVRQMKKCCIFRLIWATLLHSECSQIPITWTPARRSSLSNELPL